MRSCVNIRLNGCCDTVENKKKANSDEEIFLTPCGLIRIVTRAK